MILCYSATGNSLLAARLLAERLGESVCMIPASLPVRIPAGERRVVWVSPVYGWSLPRIVRKAIETMETDRAGATRHHLVATCGDDSGYTDAVWRRLLRRKGQHTLGAFTVIMPNTYVALPGFDTDPAELEQRKLAGVPARIDAIAGMIEEAEKSGTPLSDVTRGALPHAKTYLIHRPFMRMLVRDSLFRTDTARCTGCGACEKACPVGNITRPDSIPVWRGRCEGCLACFHSCPRHAISYLDAGDRKGRYRAPDELQN